MIDFDPDQGRLGDFLLARGMLDAATLDKALNLQQAHRRLATSALEDAVA